MAKKTGSEETGVTVRDERSITGPLKIQACRIVDDAVEVAEIQGLPDDFLHSETLAGFPPSAKFEKPGDTIFGQYIGLRRDVGPNHSRVYELSVPGKDSASLTVVVWGSTALDRQFDSAFPPVQTGDKLAIIFVGEKETKRKQNPVKLFALKVKRMTVQG